MAKNYYLILGVTADASAEDIKTAFRRRALDLHPDRSGLESGPFQEAQEAYSVLSDPEQRRLYDRQYRALVAHGRRRDQEPEPLVGARQRAEPLRPVQRASGFREMSLLESFETYRPSFDELSDRLWSNFEFLTRPKAERLESLTVEVVVGPEEARFGGRVRLWIPARVTCAACGGQGVIGFYECWRCQGHGALTTEHPLDVPLPVGARDGDTVRIPLTSFGIENFWLTVLFRVRGQPD